MLSFVGGVVSCPRLRAEVLEEDEHPLDDEPLTASWDRSPIPPGWDSMAGCAHDAS